MENLALSHPASSVVVDTTQEPTQRCAVTVIASQAGTYALSHVRVAYTDTSGKHTQEFKVTELQFHVS